MLRLSFPYCCNTLHQPITLDLNLGSPNCNVLRTLQTWSPSFCKTSITTQVARMRNCPLIWSTWPLMQFNDSTSHDVVTKPSPRRLTYSPNSTSFSSAVWSSFYCWYLSLLSPATSTHLFRGHVTYPVATTMPTLVDTQRFQSTKMSDDCAPNFSFLENKILIIQISQEFLLWPD